MPEININDLRAMCEKKAMRWTNHVFLRLLKRNIDMDEVETAVMNGEIIEQYPNDYPYPSCLVLGHNAKGQHIHVVCGLSSIEIWFITAYYPDINEWDEDFRLRKEL